MRRLAQQDVCSCKLRELHMYLPRLFSENRKPSGRRTGYLGASMFDAISLQAPDPLLLVDTLGTLRDANHAAARAFGHSRDVLRGMTLAALGDPRADGRFTARYCRADGTPFACEVSAGRVNEEGDVLCILRVLPRHGEDLYT